MKKDLHPTYRPVVFEDLSTHDYLIVSSTAETTDTIDIDGETYPVVRVEVTSSSHPFYTGKQNIVDTTGRVDRFKKLAQKASKAKEERAKLQSKKEKQAEAAKKRAEKEAEKEETVIEK